MGHLSMGVGPSRDCASDDTAQYAASSYSGSDETGPPREKKRLAQRRAPLTTKSASRSPHSVQRKDAPNRERVPEPCCAGWSLSSVLSLRPILLLMLPFS